MSERYGSYPPDEPVIGANYPPPPPAPPGQPHDSGSIGAPPRPPAWLPPAEEDEWEEGEYEDEQGYDEDEYYDDGGYYSDTPARQPMFYVFVGLAVLVAGLLIFLLFSFFKGSDGSTPTAAADIAVRIDAPAKDERIEVGKPKDVLVSATSNETITRIQLFVNDQAVDEVAITDVPANKQYQATLRLQLPRKSEFTIFVRVTTSSRATKDSAKIKVVGVEAIGERPTSIKGKVVAPTVARTSPRDDAEEVRRLNTGEEVNIVGKTRDNEWLLVDIGAGEPRWVKRNAIQEQDSLALVQVREPTPTPGPTATNTAVPSPSPSPSSTANPNAPDLAPTNAVLIDGGTRLRVTIANLASAGYSGPLVVAVSGVPADPAKQVFSVAIPANGSTTVDFSLNPAVTNQATVQVRVDPDNAIKEANHDNNNATFVLTPPAESPNLAITDAAVDGQSIKVTIRNTGGELKATEVTIRITVGSGALEQKQTLALAKGQSATISLAKLGTGQATVQLFFGTQAASPPFSFTIT